MSCPVSDTHVISHSSPHSELERASQRMMTAKHQNHTTFHAVFVAVSQLRYRHCHLCSYSDGILTKYAVNHFSAALGPLPS